MFPDGAKVEFRCNSSADTDFSQEGNSTLVCNDGAWNERIPVCKQTSSRDKFSGE
jgi:hypothetical protein